MIRILISAAFLLSWSALANETQVTCSPVAKQTLNCATEAGLNPNLAPQDFRIEVQGVPDEWLPSEWRILINGVPDEMLPPEWRIIYQSASQTVGI